MNNVIIRDIDKPSWFMRVSSIEKAKEYIDSVCAYRRSMTATSPEYYAQYDMHGNWIVIERHSK